MKNYSLRFVAVEDTIKSKSVKEGRYGALILKLYGPEETHSLHHIRTISLANDGGKWRFDLIGTLQPFENEGYYKAKRLRDRFTKQILDEYLNKMGLNPFSEDFYDTSSAILIKHNGPVPDIVREFTLAQAQGKE